MKAGQHLLVLIDELLDIARIEPERLDDLLDLPATREKRRADEKGHMER